MKRWLPAAVAACTVPVVLISSLGSSAAEQAASREKATAIAVESPENRTLVAVLKAFSPEKRRVDLSILRGYNESDAVHNRKLHSLQVNFLPNACDGSRPDGTEDALRIYGFVLAPESPFLFAGVDESRLKKHHDDSDDADLIITTCGRVVGDDVDDSFSAIGAARRFGSGLQDSDYHVINRFLERTLAALSTSRQQ